MNFFSIYSFQTVGKIFAGISSLDNICSIVSEFDVKRIAIITDMGVYKAGLVEKPKALLDGAGFDTAVVNNVPSEPEIGHVSDISEQVRRLDCEMLIGMGGGSVMDVTKLVSVLLTNNVDMEWLVNGGRIENRGLPVLMIPTTAGTGSEVTQNAIVTIPEQQLKVGIVNSKFLPDCVILDPEATIKLPPAVTASTGLDALTHALECYISKKANPLSDMFALEAIRLILGSIRRAYANGSDTGARHEMLLGSMLGGMCIAASGTAAVHALAYPLGGKYRIAHGVSNAMLLPYVMEFNMDSICGKLKQVALAAGLCTEKLPEKQAAIKVIESLHALVKELNIPSSLGRFGITGDDLDFLVEAASKVTRLLDNNPKKLAGEDIRKIYARLL